MLLWGHGAIFWLKMALEQRFSVGIRDFPPLSTLG